MTQHYSDVLSGAPVALNRRHVQLLLRNWDLVYKTEQVDGTTRFYDIHYMLPDRWINLHLSIEGKGATWWVLRYDSGVLEGLDDDSALFDVLALATARRREIPAEQSLANPQLFGASPIHGIVRGRTACSRCGVRAWVWRSTLLVCIGCDHTTEGHNVPLRVMVDDGDR